MAAYPPPPWVPALKSELARSSHPPVQADDSVVPLKLHPFQRAAVNFILGRGGRGSGSFFLENPVVRASIPLGIEIIRNHRFYC